MTHTLGMAGGQALLLAILLAPSACDWFARSEKPAPSAAPVDRLRPEEPGSAEARYLGFKPPTGMRLDARFPKEVHLVGATPQKEVLDQIRQQALVSHVELGPNQIIIPQTTLISGDPSRNFRIVISRSQGVTRVVIRDETLPPAQPGLSVAERLKQAGLSPDGKQLDLSSQR